MDTLLEYFYRATDPVLNISQNIARYREQVENLSRELSEGSSVRIDNLQTQLEKIDEYLLKIRGFQELAKKHMQSMNVSTIEAPEGYRVNINRLRRWAMMIDPQSTNDPYAQRLFVVSKCDELFLEKKKAEFSERISWLKQGKDAGTTDEIERLKKTVDALVEDLNGMVSNEDISEFFEKVISENDIYRYTESPSKFPGYAEPLEYISPGAFMYKVPFMEEQYKAVKDKLGYCFDDQTGELMLPAKLDGNSDYIINVTCSPARRKELDKGIQNLILQSINFNPAGMRKVYILDGVRFNSSSLGSLRKLEESSFLGKIPRNPEQMTSALEELMSAASDMDDVLVQYDSVNEYNQSPENDKKLAKTTVIVFGWPNSFNGADKDLLQRLLTSYERYGLSFVLVNYKNQDKKDESEKNDMPEYAMQNAVSIVMTGSKTQIAFADGDRQPFSWYQFEDSLSADYFESIQANEIKNDSIGNEYTKRFDIEDIDVFGREYKKIVLPFGIDGQDAVHTISFENENFATYLVGASRSGKSTLIHTLIAGLIRNYHPDNVELWLADFKQLEFKRYIDNLPPHVKYILLDESTELVYDLIDKLTAEMMDRQKLLGRKGVQRIDELDPRQLDKPLPVIFVILDEFSIMSQSISESDIYKLRLQNILAKGAALGIKFLFASQTFTSGVSGLTATARAQIQQRIAMKGATDEISATLELSSNIKTEQVRNWMDALPPHYALVKFRVSADTLPQVKRFLVMYFKDYAVRDEMIRHLNDDLQPVDSYEPSNSRCFVNKHAVLVDGNSFNEFDDRLFEEEIGNIRRKEAGNISKDDKFITFGTPRLMERMKMSLLTRETRENLLLAARDSERACAASVIVSIIKSLKKQQERIQIWAYARNNLYRNYKDILSGYGVEIIEGIDAVCDEIRKVKSAILSGTESDMTVIMIGMDRICVDFDYIAAGNNSEKHAASKSIGFEMNKKGFARSTEEIQLAKLQNECMAELRKLKQQLESEGLDKEEILERKTEFKRKFFADRGYDYDMMIADGQGNSDKAAEVREKTENVKALTENAAAGPDISETTETGNDMTEKTGTEQEPDEKADPEPVKKKKINLRAVPALFAKPIARMTAPVEESEPDQGEAEPAGDPKPQITVENNSEKITVESSSDKITETEHDKTDESPAENKGAYNASDDFSMIVKLGSRLGYHFMLCLNSVSDLKSTGLKMEYFRYKLSFQSSVEDSRTMFNNKSASTIPEHVCRFDDTLESFSFRP